VGKVMTTLPAIFATGGLFISKQTEKKQLEKNLATPNQNLLRYISTLAQKSLSHTAGRERKLRSAGCS